MNKNIEYVSPEDVIRLKKIEIKEKRYIKNFVKKFLIIVIVIYIVFKYIYGIDFINGQAMYPFVIDGDIAIYFRINRNYQVGDVIIYNKDNINYISRIVACEGDIIDITDNGELLINGNVQQEEVYFFTYLDDNGVEFPYKVNNGDIFALGDHRIESVDSRYFGGVSINEIKGRVITLIRCKKI